MKIMDSYPEDEGDDRISDLPDPILEQILSYLPTKNAVATSILSSRWKNLSPFATLPILLNLCDSLLLHPRKNKNEPDPPSSSFVDFVDKLLNQTLSNVPCVEGVILECDKNYGDAKIISWVSAALRFNARQLFLWFSLSESYTFFCILNGCTTLVRLVLVLDAELYLPDNFSLPNLKKFHLSEVALTDQQGDDFRNEFVGGCPALEDLCLVDCNLRDLDFLCISSLRLKKLKIENCFAESPCQFVLDAPNLEVLTFSDCVPCAYNIVSKFTSLLTANINVGPSQKQIDEALYEYHYEGDGSWRLDNRVTRLVTTCSNTFSLYLAACSIDALFDSSLQVPVFQNLISLSLGRVRWALLAHLLHNAPNLEKITFEEGLTENEEGFVNFQKSLPVSPACLMLHMKSIEFWEFKEDEDAIKLIQYVLMNGRVLQKLLILCWTPPTDDSTLIRLLASPRQSKNCEIKFN